MILGEETITRRRYAAGARGTDGVWVRGASTDTEILAGVQPATGRDLEHLPEGVRQRDPIKLYTDSAVLRTADQDGQVDADEVVVDGVVYQVQFVGRQREAAPLPNYKALAVRLKETA